MAEWKNIDPEAWIDRYGDYLYRYAYLRLGDHATAEDAVQETFLAGLRARSKYSGRASEKTWLTGILKHKIGDQIRKRSREDIPTDIPALEEVQEGGRSNRAWLACQSQLARQVQSNGYNSNDQLDRKR